MPQPARLVLRHAVLRVVSEAVAALRPHQRGLFERPDDRLGVRVAGAPDGIRDEEDGVVGFERVVARLVPERGPRPLVERLSLFVELAGGEADQLEEAAHAVGYRAPEALRVAHGRVPHADVAVGREADVYPVLHHDVCRRRLRQVVVDHVGVRVLGLEPGHDRGVVRLGELDGHLGEADAGWPERLLHGAGRPHAVVGRVYDVDDLLRFHPVHDPVGDEARVVGGRRRDAEYRRRVGRQVGIGRITGGDLVVVRLGEHDGHPGLVVGRDLG